jgi:hypothetical protein
MKYRYYDGEDGKLVQQGKTLTQNYIRKILKDGQFDFLMLMLLSKERNL